MERWRISIFADLKGLGGRFGKARWDTPARDKRIVYLAEHPALALLETLVNLKSFPEDGAKEHPLIRVEATDGLGIDRVGESSLPMNWRDRQKVTQALGNYWLARGEFLPRMGAVGSVRSAVVPAK